MFTGGTRCVACGLWPVALADDLEMNLLAGVRKILAWTDTHDTATVEFVARGRVDEPALIVRVIADECVYLGAGLLGEVVIGHACDGFVADVIPGQSGRDGQSGEKNKARQHRYLYSQFVAGIA